MGVHLRDLERTVWYDNKSGSIGILLIDLVAILDRKHKNDDYIILDRADRSPIPNTILPELSELRACECGANAARVFPALYSLVKEPQYPCSYRAIKLSRSVAVDCPGALRT